MIDGYIAALAVNSSLALLSFFGIIVGFFLCMIAPEEILPYKRYFRIFFSLVLSLALYMALFTLIAGLGPISYIIVSVITVLSFFGIYSYVSDSKRLRTIAYDASAIAIPVTMSVQYPYMYTLIILLLLGLPTTTLMAGRYVKGKDQLKKRLILLKETLSLHVWFLLIAVVPMLLILR